MSIPFSTSLPPVASGWPPDQTNTPPCPHCGTPMQDVAQFQVNLLGPRQILAGKAAVEIADVLCLCPVCHIRSIRRYQAP